MRMGIIGVGYMGGCQGREEKEWLWSGGEGEGGGRRYHR